MSFKDVLIALTTYPEPTPVSAVDDAIDLVRHTDSRDTTGSRSRHLSPTSSPRRMPEL